MRCPFCSETDTKVIDSRLVGDGDQVRRRRQCTQCSERFTTYETVEVSLPRVVKHDGRRVPFSVEKFRGGILKALEKRPVSAEEVEALVARIIRSIAASGEREVASRSIGELVMQALRELDQVAYVRFASVYRSFQDVNEFREEVDRLQRDPHPDLRRVQMSLLPKTDS